MAAARGREGIPAGDVIDVARFREALRNFTRGTERSARACGLTPQRYLLLLMVKGAEDGSQRSTVTELSRRLHLAQSTVTELCRRAEEIGLLQREPADDDGRVTYLCLTDEGERRFACAFVGSTQERAALREAIAHLDSGR